MTQLQLLKKGRWFCDRDSHLQDALFGCGKILNLNAGESLFLRGDNHDGIYAVINGVARISGVNSQGKEAVLSFIDAGLWFGEVTLFDNGVRTHDVIAQTNLQVFFVPQNKLAQLLKTYPQYWQDFGLLLAQKLRMLFISLEDYALLSAEQRLVKRLLLLCSHIDNPTAYTFNLSQQQLADMTYLSRQTTNQLLKKLQAKAVITLQYNQLTIINKSLLEQLAH
ncbi:Crp/Fnr family transcriptional regulator [Pseudoalteromonas sp. MMG010]|uniref:Crp/Fnr family transcriptional regulator n=1 Tax=Pseudoalteromonas sp. MMG010 TaxID=2822685 RepID=UPI001B39F22A|nr:Crp/Fnr family transcriptional regulator [Pseudoalteromonas sp. MMG010]MBQ4833182.1 Crp/Fnr family transcriptional regulator [Pseudoalteromonas sp. MMG010]